MTGPTKRFRRLPGAYQLPRIPVVCDRCGTEIGYTNRPETAELALRTHRKECTNVDPDDETAR